MSLAAMKAAFELQGINSTDCLVLVALGNFADEEWSCWPSKATLIMMTKLSARGLTQSIKRLEAAGYVAVETRLRNNGSQRSNRYVLHLGEGGTQVPPPGTEGPPPRRPVGEDGQRGAPLEPLLKDQKEQGVSIRAPDPFEEWWKIYPRKVDKAEARKSFWKAASKVSMEVLTAATHRFADEVKHRDRDKIPHPTTWLNRERWTDEPDANRSQTDGNSTSPANLDHGLARAAARIDAMVDGARQAAARPRRRWTI